MAAKWLVRFSDTQEVLVEVPRRAVAKNGSRVIWLSLVDGEMDTARLELTREQAADVIRAIRDGIQFLNELEVVPDSIVTERFVHKVSWRVRWACPACKARQASTMARDPRKRAASVQCVTCSKEFPLAANRVVERSE